MKIFLRLLPLFAFLLYRPAGAQPPALDSYAYKVPALVSKDPKLLPAAIGELERRYPDDLFARAIALNLHGLYVSAVYGSDSALGYHEKALVLAKQLNNLRYLGQTYNYLGVLYFRSGALKQAADYFDRSIRNFEAGGFHSDAFSPHSNRIGIYFNTGNYDKALTRVHELLAAGNLTMSRQGTLYSNLANIYSEKKQADSMEHYTRLAIEAYWQADEPRGVANNYRQSAYWHLKSRQYAAARNDFDMADSIYRSLSIKTYDWYILAGRAELYIRDGPIDSAKAYLQAVAERMQGAEGQNPTFRLDYMQLQSHWLNRIGRTGEALERMEQVMQLKDSLSRTESVTQLYELETIYQSEQKNNQISALKQQNRQQHFINLLLAGSGTVLLAGLVVLFLYFREKGRKQALLARYNLERKNQEIAQRRAEEQRLEAELGFANNQLMNKALSISEQNEFLEELMLRVDELAGKTDIPEMKKWQSVRMQLSKRLSGDENWMVFLEQFEKVNKDFFGHLAASHPDLTVNEQRLCALLKIRMSIKECAAILHISPDSVKQARYRLKKKMGLGADDDLDQHIQLLK